MTVFSASSTRLALYFNTANDHLSRQCQPKWLYLAHFVSTRRCPQGGAVQNFGVVLYDIVFVISLFQNYCVKAWWTVPDLVIWALLLSMLASGATNPPPTMMISGENFGVRIISVHLLYGLFFIKHIRTASRLLGLANLSASCTWRRHFILSGCLGSIDTFWNPVARAASWTSRSGTSSTARKHFCLACAAKLVRDIMIF